MNYVKNFSKISPVANHFSQYLNLNTFHERNKFWEINDNQINQQYIEPPNQSQCIDQVILDGPFSILECKLQADMNILRVENIKIQNTSVNGIIIHNKDEEMKDKLCVARSIRKMKVEKITVYDTCIIDNIANSKEIIHI